MLLVLSPSKTQDFHGRSYPHFTLPVQLEQSRQLVDRLRQLDVEQLGALMQISDRLARANWQRYQDFRLPFDLENARQALLVFKGDVYDGIGVERYSEAEFFLPRSTCAFSPAFTACCGRWT